MMSLSFSLVGLGRAQEKIRQAGDDLRVAPAGLDVQGGDGGMSLFKGTEILNLLL